MLSEFKKKTNYNQPVNSVNSQQCFYISFNTASYKNPGYMDNGTYRIIILNNINRG